MKTTPYKTQALSLSKLILLPLRVFLGITFVYAGIQKLTDPQFFDPAAPGYIGKQIAAFAIGSPLQSLLVSVALPHASFFGGVIALGEIAIGLGALFGLLLRPAAFFGLLISLMFFLSATWHVRPYFYGSDIVFVFCWLTLLLAGPTNTGLPSLDELLVPRFLESKSPEQKAWLIPVLSFLIGVVEKPEPAPAPVDYTQPQGKQYPGTRRISQRDRYASVQRAKKETRRNFLWGMVTGGLGMLGLAWFWNTVHTGQDTSNAGLAPTQAPTSPAPTAPGSTSTPAAGATTIAQASSVQNNSAVQFNLANGDPGILVRLNNGQFAAFDAVCTHAGCPVNYDPGAHLLVCPCHGAAFDPAKGAAVINGPADTPLQSVTISVNKATGVITTNQ